MKTRPWPLIILALLHVLAPFGNFLMNVHLSGMTMWQKYQEATAGPNLKITLVTFCAPIIAGIAIYACKKWSFWLYLAMIGLISVLNFLVYRARAGSLSLGTFLIITLVDLAVVGYFLIPAVRALYFDPRLRWWEASPRYRANRQGRWKSGETQGEGEIANFSVGGLFFKSANVPADDALVDISFVDEGRERRFSGHVIHHSKQDLTGFGVKFDRSAQTTREATEFVRKLDAQDMMIKDRLPGPEDSLGAWFKKAFTTGEGFVPNVKKKK